MKIDPVIYAIVNIVNDKHYVGQAFNKSKRLTDHKSMFRTGKHKNPKLQAAYNKYGKENFIYVILEKLTDRRYLNEREQWWIDRLNTVSPNGYNLTPVAGSALGFKHSDATKQKWSEQRKGQKRTGEALENLRKGQKKRGPVSEQAKENMRQAKLGIKWNEDRRQKRSLDMIGNTRNNGKKRTKPTSENTRKKISLAKIAGYKRRKELLDKNLKADLSWDDFLPSLSGS